MIDFQKMGFQYFGGVDLFAIEEVNKSTSLSLINEIGTDIDKFPNSKAFSGWLHLCPNQKISGGKIISKRTKKGANLLSQALKSCANSIGSQKERDLNYFFLTESHLGKAVKKPLLLLPTNWLSSFTTC